MDSPLNYSKINTRFGKAKRTYLMKAIEKMDWDQAIEWLEHPKVNLTLKNADGKTVADMALSNIALVREIHEKWNDASTSEWVAKSKKNTERILQLLDEKKAPTGDPLLFKTLKGREDLLEWALKLNVDLSGWARALKNALDVRQLVEAENLWKLRSKLLNFKISPPEQGQIWNSILRGFNEPSAYIFSFSEKYQITKEEAEKWAERALLAFPDSSVPLSYFIKNKNFEWVDKCIHHKFSVFGGSVEEKSPFSEMSRHSVDTKALPTLRKLLDPALKKIQKENLQKTNEAQKWALENINALIPYIAGHTTKDEDSKRDSIRKLKTRQKNAINLLNRMLKVIDPVADGWVDKIYIFQNPMCTFLNLINCKSTANGSFPDISDIGFSFMEKWPQMMEKLTTDNPADGAIGILDYLAAYSGENSFSPNLLNWYQKNNFDLNALIPGDIWVHGELRMEHLNQAPSQNILMRLIRKGKKVNPQIIKQLLDYGVDPNYTNPEGQNALSYVLEQEKKGSCEVLQILLDFLPDKSIPEILTHCAKQKQYEYIQALMDLKLISIPFNEESRKNWTPEDFSNHLEPLDQGSAIAFAETCFLKASLREGNKPPSVKRI